VKKHAAFKWKDAISAFPVSPGSAEALVRWGGKVKYILIAYFLGNICAKNCRNRAVYVKLQHVVKVGRFLRHGVLYRLWDINHIISYFQKLKISHDPEHVPVGSNLSAMRYSLITICIWNLKCLYVSPSPKIWLQLQNLTRRPASADRTARRQFQATVQPVNRTQASDAMTSRLPRYEAKCVQRRCFECGSVPLLSDIKGTELPPANILIPLERQLIALQLCRWEFLYNETFQQTIRPLLSKLSKRRQI